MSKKYIRPCCARSVYHSSRLKVVCRECGQDWKVMD